MISLLSLIKDSDSDFGWVQKKFREIQRQPTVKCCFTQIHQNQSTAVYFSIWTIYWFNLWIAKRVFSNRKQNEGNHWKHWIFENLVDIVNTNYRKHHRPSSDEIVVNHQSPMSQQTQLSELIEMDQLPNWNSNFYNANFKDR